MKGFDHVKGHVRSVLIRLKICIEHVGAKPHVRPHPKNTPKQYRILVIRGGMKTLAVRRDFDCCFVGFRVLI